MANKQIIAVIFLILTAFPCAAGQYYPVICWECLNLNQTQAAQIKMLDVQWQNTSYVLRKKIEQEQKKLRYIMTNPFATDKEIRELQDRILASKQELRNRALEIFLRKRGVLTPLQRRQLHEIISR